MKRISVFLILVLFSISACATVKPQDRDLRDSAMLMNPSGVDQAIASGADVNSKDKNGWTALMFGASMGCVDCVKSIIAAGADVNAVNDDGKTALILITVLSGNADCLKLLITAKADVNIRDSKNATALGYAKAKGFAKCIELLEAAGATL